MDIPDQFNPLVRSLAASHFESMREQFELLRAQLGDESVDTKEARREYEMAREFRLSVDETFEQED